MKRLLSLLIVTPLLLVGCAQEAEHIEEIPVSVSMSENLHDATVYFESLGNIVLPVVAQIEWGSQIFENTANLMVESELTAMLLEGTGLSAVLPEGTEISASVSGNTAFVSIYSDEIPHFDEFASRASLSAVVNTFLDFEGIDYVDVKVNNTGAFGTWDTSVPIHEMIVNSERNMSGDVNIPVTLYYRLGENGMSVPVTRYVEQVSAQVVVDEMLEHPRENSLKCMFPEGCELISTTLNENILTLDFSEEFLTIKENPQHEKMLVSALDKVVKQVPGVGSLQITVQGVAYEMPATSVFNVISGLRITE